MTSEQAEKFLGVCVKFMHDEGLPMPNKDMPPEKAFAFMRDFFLQVANLLEANRIKSGS